MSYGFSELFGCYCNRIAPTHTTSCRALLELRDCLKLSPSVIVLAEFVVNSRE